MRFMTSERSKRYVASTAGRPEGLTARRMRGSRIASRKSAASGSFAPIAKHGRNGRPSPTDARARISPSRPATHPRAPSEPGLAPSTPAYAARALSCSRKAHGSTDTASAGSFPSLRTGMKPTPSLYAIGAPKMKPRDSIPTTASIFRGPIRSRSPSIDALKESPSLRSVVMSLKRIPGLGKSGTSRILLARSFVCTAMALEISVRADGDEARPPHPLLPAGVLRAHRAERRRLLVRREPHRAADHPLQGRALLRRHRADDGRRPAPRGHGPRGHRRGGPLALDPERLLRGGPRADRRRAHGERRVRRPHREAARAVPGLRLHPDGRPRRRASRARARARRAAPAGRRAPLEHSRPRARGPGLPAAPPPMRPAEGLRVRSSDDPGRGRALRRVRARPGRGLPVPPPPAGPPALLRRRLHVTAAA